MRRNRLQLAGITVVSVTALVVVAPTTPANAEPATPPYQTVAVPNASFENTDGNGIPQWSLAFGETNHFRIDDTDAATGKRSLLVDDASDSDSQGLLSSPVSVRPGKLYAGQAKAKLTSGSVDLYLYFYDSSGAKIAETRAQTLAQPSARWVGVSSSATAPEGAATMRLMIYSGQSAVTAGHVDDVRATTAGTEQALGSPVHSTTANGAVTGVWSDGRAATYLVSQGDPAILTVVDAADGAKLTEVTLPDVGESYGARGVVQAPDGTVYIGAAHLYSYVPGDSDVSDLGQPTGDSLTWALAVDEQGRIFGGTYPNGLVFRYDPASGQSDSCRVDPAEKYVRSIGVADGYVYAGLGTPAKLYQLAADDLCTKTEIALPDATADDQFTYDLRATAGKVLVRTNPSGAIHAWDVATTTWSDVIDNGRGVAFSPAYDSGVYWIQSGTGSLRRYDLVSGEVTDTGVVAKGPLGSFTGNGYGWVDLSGTGLSEHTLVFAASSTLFAYDPASGDQQQLALPLPELPAEIHRLATGPDGNIYASAYPTGGLGWYDPKAGTFGECPMDSVGQAESMVPNQGELWLGIYSNALINVFDPAKPCVAAENPLLVANLSHASDRPQDRPYAMASTPHGVFAGTVPEYGYTGGRLFLLPQGGGNPRVVSLPESVTEHTISALAYDATTDSLYVGTSLHGGLGVSDPEGEAHLIRLDLDTDKVAWDTVPLPGETCITALHVRGNGEVLGIAGSRLFRADPSTGQAIRSTDIAWDSGSASWGGGAVIDAGGGYVYAQARGTLVVADPSTLDWRTIATNTGPTGLGQLAKDRDGALYYSSDTILRRLR